MKTKLTILLLLFVGVAMGQNGTRVDTRTSSNNIDSAGITITQVDTNFTITATDKQGLNIRQNGNRKLQIKPNGDLKFYGDLEYGFIHGRSVKDSIPITFGNVPRYVFTKLTVNATVAEAEGIGVYADSVKFLKAGSYRVFLYMDCRGSLDNEYKVELFKNNVKTMQGGRFSGGGTSNYILFSWFWYADNMAVNDVISFKYQNQSSGNAPLTVYEYKLIIEKIPEY